MSQPTHHKVSLGARGNEALLVGRTSDIVLDIKRGKDFTYICSDLSVEQAKELRDALQSAIDDVEDMEAKAAAAFAAEQARIALAEQNARMARAQLNSDVQNVLHEQFCHPGMFAKCLDTGHGAIADTIIDALS